MPTRTTDAKFLALFAVRRLSAVHGGAKSKTLSSPLEERRHTLEARPRIPAKTKRMKSTKRIVVVEKKLNKLRL